MKTIKVSEATNIQLDWLVAECEGATDLAYDGITLSFRLDGQLKVLAKGWAQSMSYTPTTDWAQMGPIIEREEIGVGVSDTGNVPETKWVAVITKGNEAWVHGPTPLIAAARCYVASKLGDEVEIPKELM